MVFGGVCHMTQTGIPFPIFHFRVSYLLSVAEVYILFLNDTALLITHNPVVPALAFSRTQSQIWASLSHTLSLFTVGKTLMLCLRVSLFLSGTVPSIQVQELSHGIAA